MLRHCFKRLKQRSATLRRLVELLVEGRRAPAAAAAPEPVADLVGPLGNGVGDAPPPEPGPDGLGAVALVAQDVVGPVAWSTEAEAGHPIASTTAVNWVQSLVFPPVTVKASGRPPASHAR